MIFVSGVAVFMAMAPVSVCAQNIPSSADPSRLTTFQGDAFTRYGGGQSASVLSATAPQLSPDMAGLTFTLKSLTVRGQEAFSPLQIASIYRPYIGKEISLAQLFSVLQSIQQLYIDEGFALSKVLMPPQSIESGAIVFDVVEGFVGQVQVDPTIPDSAIVHDFVQKAISMRPLNTRQLERMMLLLNDRPGLEVMSVLAIPDHRPDKPGEVKLVLQNGQTIDQQNKIVNAQIGFDTLGSNYTGAGQFSGEVEVQNIGYHLSDVVVSAKAATSLPELRQMAIDYTVPVWGVSGTTWGVSASLAKTEPGSSLDSIDVKGNSLYLRTDLQYPIIRQRDKTVVLSAGFNYKNSQTDVLDSLVNEDRVRTIDVGASYSSVDRFKGLNSSYFRYTRALGILDASRTGDDNLSRSDARGSFQKAELFASRLQAVSCHVDIYGEVQGQYTSFPLLSSEEFGFGGGRAGRGYDPSEMTGDKGVSASIEVRYNSSLLHDVESQSFVFYDFGKVWNIDPDDKNKVSAASAGVGVRLSWRDKLLMSTSIAFPLTRFPSDPPDYMDDSGARLLFSATHKF